MTASGRAAVWVLLGSHRGDNNQVLALAEALGLPFRAIELRYKSYAHLPAICRRVTISQLEDSSRAEIVAPWPSLVLGIGQRSVPVARYIQQQSDGFAKIVRLGDPMISHKHFDLVITTTQYAVRDADNVVRLPLTITDQEPVQPNKLEERWLETFDHPRRLLIIGGKTSLWRFGPELVSRSIAALQHRATRDGGSVIAVTSPRTSPKLVAAALTALGDKAVVTGPFPRYAALLQSADEIHVTGDSVSMLSDAVATGKPVGLIPLEKDGVSRFLDIAGRLRGSPFRMRNLDKFWNDLRMRGLVGTIDAPRAGSFSISPVNTAVDAVFTIIGGRHAPPVRVPDPRAAVASPKPEAVAL